MNITVRPLTASAFACLALTGACPSLATADTATWCAAVPTHPAISSSARRTDAIGIAARDEATGARRGTDATTTSCIEWPTHPAISPTAPHKAAPGKASTNAAGPATSLAIVVDTPNGERMRLVRWPGSGWRTQPLLAGTKLAALAMTPAVAPIAAVGDERLSLFIDGPSGFVFAWNADDAKWDFVGRLRDQPH